MDTELKKVCSQINVDVYLLSNDQLQLLESCLLYFHITQVLAMVICLWLMSEDRFMKLAKFYESHM